MHLVRDGGPVPEVAEPLRAAARVVAVSEALAREIRGKTGRDADVIPNAVDQQWDPAFQRSARRHLAALLDRV